MSEVKYVACTPYIVERYFKALNNTCKLDIFSIDNTGKTNTGAAGGWNCGFKKCFESNKDWLILISAAVRFGKLGGLDFIEALSKTTKMIVCDSHLYGWHLIAFHKELLHKVGKWDENFHPYGFDDIDISMRIQNVYSSFDCDIIITDASDTIMAHSVKLAGIRTDTDQLIDYFIMKWGRHPGESEIPYHKYPFNNPEYDNRYWPDSPNGGSCKYEWEN